MVFMEELLKNANIVNFNDVKVINMLPCALDIDGFLIHPDDWIYKNITYKLFIERPKYVVLDNMRIYEVAANTNDKLIACMNMLSDRVNYIYTNLDILAELGTDYKLRFKYKYLVPNGKLINSGTVLTVEHFKRYYE